MCDGKPYVAGLEQFAERVLNNLWNAIKKFYPPEVSQPVQISYMLYSNCVYSIFVVQLCSFHDVSSLCVFILVFLCLISAPLCFLCF